MREVLSLLVRLNFVASMAILLVLLFRLPTRRYLGAHQAYALWLVVPVSMIGALVLPVFGSEQIGLVEAVSGRVESWLSAGAHCMVLAGLWASGLVINIGLAAWRCGRFLALARAGRAGPAIFGVFAPRLVTPSDFSRRFTPEERRLVRAHERAHMDRLDARFNALTLVIQCLCWFNPLVHSAARTMRQDQELACDATVMLRFPMERRRYAETLLRSLESSTISPLGCGWTGSAARALGVRVTVLMRQPPDDGRRYLGTALLVALCAVVLAGAWAAQPPIHSTPLVILLDLTP